MGLVNMNGEVISFILYLPTQNKVVGKVGRSLARTRTRTVAA